MLIFYPQKNGSVYAIVKVIHINHTQYVKIIKILLAWNASTKLYTIFPRH